MSKIKKVKMKVPGYNIGGIRLCPDPATCPSCKVPFEDHLGLTHTCKRLQKALSALRVIRTWADFDLRDRPGTLEPRQTIDLCDKTLKGVK